MKAQSSPVASGAISLASDRDSLPPLEELLPEEPLQMTMGRKLDATLRFIREVAVQLRQERSRAFYSMREFQTVLKVPLRTVAIAFKHMEAEGLLLRIRGSHTKLLGYRAQPAAQFSTVLGWPENLFSLRHYVWHRAFSRDAGDALRKKQMMVDTILHWDSEEILFDFLERLLLHNPDFVIWYQPLNSHREIIASLKDRGIRTIIATDQELPNFETQVRIDYREASEQVLSVWQEQYDIRQIALVEGKHHSRKRLRQFQKLAEARGMECHWFKSSPDLAGRLCLPKTLPAGSGIVLLDDWGAADFALRDPNAFLKAMHLHRVLFGREVPSIPFAKPRELCMEAITVQRTPVINAIGEVITDWQVGRLESPPKRVKAAAQIGLRNPTWM